MKNLLIFVIIYIFSFSIFSQEIEEQKEGCSDVYSYMIYDIKNNNILSEIRPTQTSYPASLVKLMTAYLTFEAIEKGKLSPYTVLTASQRVEEVAAVNKITTLKLKEGDKIKVRDAIRGTIIKSFNETAVILAEGVAGSEWNFVRKMNKKAQELGMINTSFRNASGLHEEGQYTNSYDLARLVKAIKRDFPGYYWLFALKDFKYQDKKFKTHNHVLVDYKGAEGLKTGFTRASGFNLISAAKKRNKRIVSILLGCSTHQKRDKFTKELLDDAFATLAKKRKIGLKNKLAKNFDYTKKRPQEIDSEGYLRHGMNQY